MKHTGWKKFCIQTALLLVITVLTVVNRYSLRHFLMIRAVEFDDATMCRICIRLGEDVNAGMYGATYAPIGDDYYLNYATRVGSSNAMELLIHKGASLNTLDFLGRTPLHSAIQRQDFRAVRLLLDNGASTTLQDSAAQTPLALAKSVKNAYILQEIKNHLH